MHAPKCPKNNVTTPEGSEPMRPMRPMAENTAHRTSTGPAASSERGRSARQAVLLGGETEKEQKEVRSIRHQHPSR